MAMNPGAPDMLLVIADHLDWPATKEHVRLLQIRSSRIGHCHDKSCATKAPSVSASP